MTKTILFTIRKGGVGKTTICSNQACLFAKKGKTLLIDLDPQANIISQFGYNPYKSNFKTVINLINNNKLEDVVISFDKHKIENLDIIPSNYLLTDYYEEKEKDPYKNIFRKIVEIIKSNKYEYILIDTNPAWNALISYLIQIANVVCIPFIPEPNSNWATIDFIDEILPTVRDLSGKAKVFIIPNRFSVKKRKGIVVEDRSYQFLSDLKNKIQYSQDKKIFVTNEIANSEQYANSIAFDKKPIVLVEGIKTYNKPKKQQKELNEFIVSKL